MNGKVETEDKSGQPRSMIALEEALRIVEKAIIHWTAEVPPMLFVQLPTIRDVLAEAMAFREVTEGKQIGWYNPDSKRFRYMDVGTKPTRGYTERVYVFNKP